MGQPLVTDAPNEHQTAKGDNLKEHNQAHPQEKGGDKHGDHHHKKSKAIPFKYHQEKKDGRNRLDIRDCLGGRHDASAINPYFAFGGPL